jgi:CRP-like cAMP-binding protein
MRQLPPLFDGLNDVDVYTARRYFQERDVAAGDVIIQEGQIASALVCVVSGVLEIRSHGVKVGEAATNQIVGEMALFEKGYTSADVVAAGPGRIMVLDRAGYDSLRDTLHPMTANIEKAALGLLVSRVRRVGERVTEFAAGTPAAPVRPTERFLAAVVAHFGRGGLFSPEPISPLGTLRKCPVFADAPHDGLVAIAERLNAQVYGPGSFLCTEGEIGRTMYFLDEGEVEVVVATPEHGVQRIAKLPQGSAFGLVSLVEGVPRMASCISKTRVVVQALDRDSWLALVDEPYIAGTTFRRAMIRVLSEQLSYSNHQLADYESSRADLGPLLRAGSGVDRWPS